MIREKAKIIKRANRNFRLLYRFRDQKRYNLIGAGTVFKIVDENNAFEAFLKAFNAKEDVVTYDVKNVVNFKFYSK